MELLLVPRVQASHPPPPSFITGKGDTSPIMVFKMIYVNIDYTVGSRPSYIDPIPVQSLGYLTPSPEAMIKMTHRCQSKGIAHLCTRTHTDPSRKYPRRWIQ